MRTRVHTAQVIQRLQQVPAVVLVGPRQSGKTTLAKGLEGQYFDLELAEERTRLDVLWPSLLASTDLIIFDEAQAMPEVFARMRAAIDADRKRNGRFLILGSVAPALMREVADLLTGRASVLELPPFSLSELPDKEVNHAWFFGGYPGGGVDDATAYPRWHLDYLKLLTERDLPSWGLPAKPAFTMRMIRMLATLQAQEHNASRLASNLGVTHPTIESYLEFLEGAFLFRRLQPFHTNLKKRLVKRPKLFLRDSGLLHALLHTHDFDHLLVQPWVGASWESFVIEQILRVVTLQPFATSPFFFRTHDGYELDLLLDAGTARIGIECKLTSSPNNADLARLNKVGKMVGLTHSYLVSMVPESHYGERQSSCNLRDLLTHLPKALSTHAS